MNFGWNIWNWLQEQLPSLMRKRKMTEYLYSLLAPLRNIFSRFTILRGQTEAEIARNGIVLVLQEYLNDRFDPQSRGIRIEQPTADCRWYKVFTDEERRPVSEFFLYEDEDPRFHDHLVYVFPDEEMKSDVDMIVNLPSGFFTVPVGMEAILEKYVLPPFRYKIKTATL